MMSLAPALAQDYRTFSSNDGRSIEARITGSDSSETVTIRTREGREFKGVPISRFSLEDQSFIRDWQKAELERKKNADITSRSRLVIDFYRGKADNFNNYGDIDDRVVSFEPEVVVKNEEFEQSYSSVKGHMVILGRQTTGEEPYVILSREEFTMDLNANSENRWAGKPFSCQYDPDYTGFDYAGYLIVLYNKQGDIIFTKTPKTVWERSARKIIQAKFYTGYESDFARPFSLHSTYGLPSWPEHLTDMQ